MARAANSVRSTAAALGLRPAELIRLDDGRVVGIRLEIPIPASKKNNKVVRQTKKGIQVGWSSKVTRQERLIAELAAAGVPMRAAGPLLGDVDDVRMLLRHDVAREVVQVEVYRIGPPKEIAGRTGRRRDVPNLFELTCDALEGVVYGNDRQIAECTGVRHIGGA